MFSRFFGMIIRGNFRALFSFLLGFALLGALWNASLLRLSSHETATGIITQVGIQVINPVLVQGKVGGLSQSALATLQKNCVSTASVPGLNVVVPCAQIKGASFENATGALYRAVAESYYQNGVSGVFALNVPQPIVDILSGKSLVPQVQSVPVPGGPNVNVPHLPDNPLFSAGAAFGFSLSSLTAQGHTEAQSRLLWFGGAALLLLLILALTSKGWKRLTAVGHALIGSAIPGVTGIGLVVFLTNRYPEQ
nr:hypothetical protein [Ktedonobacterales bacterium]